MLSGCVLVNNGLADFFFFIDLFDEVLLLKAEPHQEQQYLVQHFLTKQQKGQITQKYCSYEIYSSRRSLKTLAKSLRSNNWLPNVIEVGFSFFYIG